jgi:protein SCO1/2
MTKRILILAVFLALLAATLWTWRESGFLPFGNKHPAGPQGGDFTLQSAKGPVSLHDFRGKVVLLYFGYTYCPDVCPTSLALIAQSLKRLSPEEARQVQVVFVSVDPERDTLQKLQEYGNFFHPGTVGLTGTPDEVAKVAKQYGVMYRKQAVTSAAGYVIDHSSYTYVIGRDGTLRGKVLHAAAPAEMIQTVRSALKP